MSRFGTWALLLALPALGGCTQMEAASKAREEAGVRQYVDTIARAENGVIKRAVARRARFEKECDARGRPTIGMHWQRLYETCWGKPDRMNTTQIESGRHDQLVYPWGYVYLTNGIVTAIQTSQ